jgi:hypothetical protein
MTRDGFYRRDGSDIEFRQVTRSLELPQKDDALLPLGGQTWGIAWGDADNNLYPDLYLNHHTRRSTGRPEVPDSHLLFNPGAPDARGDYVDLEGVDQHTAMFIDINGDGQQDLFELQGGRGGQATAESHGTVNRVILGKDGTFTATNSAADFQLEYAQGRGRNPTPLNINGSLGLLVTNSPRADGQFPTTLFLRTPEGTFEESPDRFVEQACDEEVAKEGSCELVQNADLEGFRLAIPAYFDEDDHIDVILLGSLDGGGDSVKLFTGSAEGVFTASSFHGPAVKAHDGAVLDADNDGRFDLWLTGQQTAREQTRLNSKLYKFSPEGEFLQQPLYGMVPFFRPAAGPVVAGDFDNDGDEDVITYEADRSNEFMFSVWENGGTGQFQRTLFFDHENLGIPRSVALADYNLDGSLDLLFGDGAGRTEMVHGIGGYILLEGVPNGNHWLQLDIRDPWYMRGLGARVFVTAGERTIVRGVFGGVHEAAQNSVRLHFGLAGYDKADIRVLWPDGASTELRNISADQVLRIDYPEIPTREPD